MSAEGPDPTDNMPAAEPRVKPRAPLFLERRSYRQRRVLDALRLVPLLGALLWAVPLLWRDGSVPTSRAILYIFGVWAGLVVLALALTRRIETRTDDTGPDDAPRDAGHDAWRP